jgi:hypothetical protein
MTNKKSWLGILVMVLVFGMAVIGCNNDPDNGNGSDNNGGGSSGGGGGTDSALNGTWERTSDDYEFTLNNGNFEGRFKDVISADKGTYTTNNGIMTMKITHWWGVWFNTTFGVSFNATLDPKWYTKSEIQSAIPSYPASSLDNIFPEQTWTYSISGKTFTRTLTDGSYTQTYTKK